MTLSNLIQTALSTVLNKIYRLIKPVHSPEYVRSQYYSTKKSIAVLHHVNTARNQSKKF